MKPRLLEREDYRRDLQALHMPRFAQRQPGGPFIVALEGPNGAGKTTLCGLLAREFGAARCLGTDKAWFGKAFKTRMIRDADWFASAMFFLSGCFEQMRVRRQGREPLLFMDRSLWSTFAVHGAHSPERLAELVAMIHPIAGYVPVPDLVLVLEASLSTCQARSARKRGQARALDELTAHELFHVREREFYRWLSTQVTNLVFLDVNHATPGQAVRKATAAVRQAAGERLRRRARALVRR